MKKWEDLSISELDNLLYGYECEINHLRRVGYCINIIRERKKGNVMEHTISTENVVKAPEVSATPGEDREYNNSSEDIALETLKFLEREEPIVQDEDDIEPKEEKTKLKL
jgi:hypothetical protein